MNMYYNVQDPVSAQSISDRMDTSDDSFTLSGQYQQQNNHKRDKRKRGYSQMEQDHDSPSPKRRRVTRPVVTETPTQPTFPVTIRTLSGKSVVVKLKPTERVRDVKDHLFRNEGIPPTQQRLIWNGKHLADERLLSEYGVNSGDTIHLVLALR